IATEKYVSVPLLREQHWPGSTDINIAVIHFLCITSRKAAYYGKLGIELQKMLRKVTRCLVARVIHPFVLFAVAGHYVDASIIRTCNSAPRLPNRATHAIRC